MNVWKAIFTPMFGPQYWHFVVAMLVTAGYVVAGVYATGWLRGRRDHYHRLGFTVPFTVAAVCSPSSSCWATPSPGGSSTSSRSSSPRWRSSGRTSLTVAEGAGAAGTLRWLGVVTLVAVLLVFPAIALLYWLDTHGELESLTDADLRRRGAGDQG
ncbi:cytochrome ubiquinol oxidase subunit I [Streptomyces massasporeus]|nr:cytochrome ubiquinol oxidase subunit I [Streptomyces massasporeus]GGV81741.1 hypothetical protein GCM10010228_55370 [Streptomyces massasporeus]